MQKKNLFAMIGRAFVAVFAVLALVFGLSACSNEEAAVREMLEGEFASLTSISGDDLKEALGETGDLLESVGISADELWGAMFGNLTYSIDNIKVDGDKATADITVTNVDITSVVKQWNAAIQTYAASPEAQEVFRNEGESGLYHAIFQMLIDLLNAEDAPTVTNTTTAQLVKDSNGHWRFAANSQSSQILFGVSDPSVLF
ncbi:MAG: hypothetical protein IJH87_00580 [Atopobiaceae bacterium]|nr:hypothetical protein [Atopobiaceae bacterium]